MSFFFFFFNQVVIVSYVWNVLINTEVLGSKEMIVNDFDGHE